jgi:hypothetical protein
VADLEAGGHERDVGVGAPADVDRDFLDDRGIEAIQGGAHAVWAGRQERRFEEALGVGDVALTDAGGGVRHRHRDARQHAAGRIPGDPHDRTALGLSQSKRRDTQEHPERVRCNRTPEHGDPPVAAEAAS